MAIELGTIIVLIAGILAYGFGLITYVNQRIDEMHKHLTADIEKRELEMNAKINDTNDKISDVITNYKDRFADLKCQLAETKTDILGRLDIIVTALTKDKHE